MPSAAPSSDAATPGAAAAATVLASATATSVLERPVPTGAAPSITDHVTARVVAATDSPGLAMLICDKLTASEDCEILSIVDSLAELRAAVAATEPTVVIVDLTLTPDGREDICEALEDIHPHASTIGLIPGGKGAHALALRGYTVGFAGLLVVTDDIGNGQLAYAVRCVAAGKPFYGPSVHAALLEHWGQRVLANPSGLSEREIEVARLAVAGVPRAQIARQLYLSPWTVKTHLVRVRAKLGVTNPNDRAELAERLRQFNLLPPTDTD